MRLALAKLLLKAPDVLLLDEPTNYLDLDARNWLLDFLRGYPYAMVLVSHDRHFLDTTISRIAEIFEKKIEIYNCNFTHYCKQKIVRTEKMLSDIRRKEEEIQKIKRFIDRNRFRKDRAKQVQSRIKMLERLPEIERPKARKQIHFRFPESPRSGRHAIQLKNVFKSYGQNRVFSGADLIAERGDRIGVVGLNGSGKSTLLRMLAGGESFDSGERILGHNVSIGYFAQDESEKLGSGRTVLDELSDGARLEMIGSLRKILGGFLFSGEDVEKDVGVLSGGERNRLAMAKLLLKPTNLLLLDEPTNHLDIESIEVVLRALQEYQGAIIFVSHDRYFINKLAKRIADVENKKIEIYPGIYEDFLAHKEGVQRQKKYGELPEYLVETEEEPGAAPTTNERKTSRTEWEIKKKEKAKESAVRKISQQKTEEKEEIERKIGMIEEEIANLEGEMAVPKLQYDQEKVKQDAVLHRKLQKELEGLYKTWEKFSEEK
jgi:ATP-binding cassette subfamily F protein 3